MWKSLLSVACPLIIASCSAPADDSVGDSNPQRTGVQGENPSASDLTETGHSEQTGQIGEAGAELRPELPFELVEGEPMYTVLPVDGIPAIDEPVFVGVVEAMEFMADDEPVLGVVGPNGTAKCYSAWLLDGHEIVNDELDGVAIAATW